MRHVAGSNTQFVGAKISRSLNARLLAAMEVEGCDRSAAMRLAIEMWVTGVEQEQASSA
jgi:hypothetical protein